MNTRTLPRLTQQFEHTTLNTAQITAYLIGIPRYLEAGVYQGVSEKACHYLAYADGVEFWLRRYLAGKPATLHNVFREIRAFLAHDETAARHMILFVLNAVADTMLQNEWYELMKPYNIARKRIQKTFNI
ncbi:hypothetical protein IC229_18475 [Spirosoma sp. BT702]|uniref:Uncharacterized protein n=1 Tax=Spirosoma profusum TaxID=2771354 RepID=A0A926XXP7_9BACT|nr:hypothetical protein [Spirosoma profusum]MBD2702639.1 hypothetical protein [Spirosoma profusum]